MDSSGSKFSWTTPRTPPPPPPPPPRIYAKRRVAKPQGPSLMTAIPSLSSLNQPNILANRTQVPAQSSGFGNQAVTATSPVLLGTPSMGKNPATTAKLPQGIFTIQPSAGQRPSKMTSPMKCYNEAVGSSKLSNPRPPPQKKAKPSVKDKPQGENLPAIGGKGKPQQVPDKEGVTGFHKFQEVIIDDGSGNPFPVRFYVVVETDPSDQFVGDIRAVEPVTDLSLFLKK